MKNASPNRLLLQWTFHRAGRYVTCQLSQVGEMFRLALLAHAADSEPHTTTFASGIQAMQRHAEIALALRAAGWSVASYTARAADGHIAAA